MTEVQKNPTTVAGAGDPPAVASIATVPTRASVGSIASTSIPETVRVISIRGPMAGEMKVVHDLLAERERLENLRGNRPRVTHGSSST
jgi:hypothetical protein